jgi:hypothetical protein
MLKVINTIICALGLVVLGSCRSKLTPVDYVRYVNDEKNGLKKVSRIEGWEFCMLYHPADYTILKENSGQNKNYNADKRKEDLQSTALFSISIKRTDNSISPVRYRVSSLEEYNSRLNYYINHAMKDIRLMYGNDTLTPSSYVFENNYNLGPMETMVVGFELPFGKPSPAKNMRLSFLDRVFKNGIINAEFSTDAINSIPSLIQ